MRPFEVNSFMSRTQDISPIKQTMDTKPHVEQHAIVQNNEKQINHNMESVIHKEDAEFESPFNKDGKGGAEYEENKRRKKQKEEEEGKVTVKTRATFDIRI